MGSRPDRRHQRHRMERHRRKRCRNELCWNELCREVQCRKEHGAVTAELAVSLPAVVLLIAAALTGASAGVTQLRLEEAARAAARELMRGDSGAAETAARRIAGSDADISISAEGEWQRVQVASSVAAPLLELLPVRLSADAVAFPEGTVGDE